jgi:hypothetical protein
VITAIAVSFPECVPQESCLARAALGQITVHGT